MKREMEWILFLAAIAVLLTGVGLQQNKLSTASLTSASGFTVNSITTTRPISNDADIASANFIVTATANSGGQSIVGDFGSNDFKQWLPNLVVQYPLKIEISGTSEKLTYSILNQGALYRYTTAYRDASGFWSGAKCDPAPAYCFPIDTNRMGLGLDRVLIVNKIPVGSHARFDNPDISWVGKLVVTINGVPFVKDIGSAETPGSVDYYSVTGEWVANAKWTGSLVTGQAVPNQNLYVAAYSKGRQNWNIASKTYYEDYVKSLTSTDTQFQNWQTQLGRGFDATGYAWSSNFQSFEYAAKTICGNTSCSNVINQINTHGANLDTLLNRNDKIGYGSITSTSSITSGTESGGNVIDVIDRRITNPQLVLTVKAAKLGVLIPVGKPQIVSINSKTFSSGDGNGVAVVTIKNIGTAAGTFSATFLEISGTFKRASNVESSKVTLRPGETGAVTVFISHGTSAQDATKTATMHVYDVNKPSNYDEKNFDITMTVPKKCTPGATRTDGGVVYTCKADGTGEDVTLNCAADILVYKAGAYDCQKKEQAVVTTTGTPTGTVTPTATSNKVNKPRIIDETAWYGRWSTWAIAGLVVLFVYVYSQDRNKNNKRRGKK